MITLISQSTTPTWHLVTIVAIITEPPEDKQLTVRGTKKQLRLCKTQLYQRDSKIQKNMVAYTQINFKSVTDNRPISSLALHPVSSGASSQEVFRRMQPFHVHYPGGTC